MAVKIENEDQYQQLLNNIAANKNQGENSIKQNPNLEKKPELKTKKSAKKTLNTPSNHSDNENPPSPKRFGVKEAPIISSLRTCSIDVECSKDHVTLAFKGARMFTLNEILAILQYRSYIIFSYKKQWQTLVNNGLRMLGNKKPHFDGPCKVTLFRQAKKKVDRDSLMVMFKYIIDALKDDPKSGLTGIFPDDNPDIVYSDEKIQRINHNVPIVGIKIERIHTPLDNIETSILDLFELPPHSLREPEPVKPTKLVTKKNSNANNSNNLHSAG